MNIFLEANKDHYHYHNIQLKLYQIIQHNNITKLLYMVLGYVFINNFEECLKLTYETSIEIFVYMKFQILMP